jgi:ribosomal protein S27AE
MIEYYCKKCNSTLKVTYSKDEIPTGKCPKCKEVYENLNNEIENHMTYRDNIRHCPNCGKNFKTKYGPPEHGGSGYDLQKHTCPRCGWVIGWQHTFSHGEYVVAMESEELYDQRQYFWSQLRKYGRPDAAGDGEYAG